MIESSPLTQLATDPACITRDLGTKFGGKLLWRCARRTGARHWRGGLHHIPASLAVPGKRD
jgi:hypothetical protein